MVTPKYYKQDDFMDIAPDNPFYQPPELTKEELNEISEMLYEVASHFLHNLKQPEEMEKAMYYAEKTEIMAKGFLEREPEEDE